ncbi:MAG: lipoyl(octanoyl) transferase LipB [Eubacteriaceae bacterium]|nr:lipoyl(octanoyl) transferase LipB [Eubacteriaceae bacterium]
MKLNVIDLGTMEYGKCLSLQTLIRDMRDNDEVGDTLLLVEHPPVLTLGCRGKDDNVLAEKSVLEKMGISIFKTSRGGDVTYHGPGQIVGYPIINLKKAGLGAKDYLDNIQNMFIRLLKIEYGIEAHKEDKEYTGIWIGTDKITAIGIHIRHMITMHGFAYNVKTNLDHFKLINPCGLTDRNPISLEKILGREIDMAEAKDLLIRYFGEEFNAEINKIDLGEVINGREY